MVESSGYGTTRRNTMTPTVLSAKAIQCCSLPQDMSMFLTQHRCGAGVLANNAHRSTTSRDAGGATAKPPTRLAFGCGGD